MKTTKRADPKHFASEFLGNLMKVDNGGLQILGK
jgi:hypothetical protein